MSPDKMMTYKYPASLNFPESGRLISLFGFVLLTIVDVAFFGKFREFQLDLDL